MPATVRHARAIPLADLATFDSIEIAALGEDLSGRGRAPCGAGGDHGVEHLR